MNIRLMGSLNPYKKMNTQRQNILNQQEQDMAFKGGCWSKPEEDPYEDPFYMGTEEEGEHQIPEWQYPDLNSGRRFESRAGASSSYPGAGHSRSRAGASSSYSDSDAGPSARKSELEQSIYEYFGDTDKSSKQALKRTYSQHALRLHPDKGGDEEQFKRMKNAYEHLSKE